MGRKKKDFGQHNKTRHNHHNDAEFNGMKFNFLISAFDSFYLSFLLERKREKKATFFICSLFLCSSVLLCHVTHVIHTTYGFYFLDRNCFCAYIQYTLFVKSPFSYTDTLYTLHAKCFISSNHVKLCSSKSHMTDSLNTVAANVVRIWFLWFHFKFLKFTGIILDYWLIYSCDSCCLLRLFYLAANSD